MEEEDQDQTDVRSQPANRSNIQSKEGAKVWRREGEARASRSPFTHLGSLHNLQL